MATIKVEGENAEVRPLATPNTVVGGEPFVLQQVADLFDFRPSEYSLNKRKIEVLVEYAKTKTSDHSPESIKRQIRRLSTKLGSPKTGESFLNYMHRYAYLDLQSRRAEAEKKELLE